MEPKNPMDGLPESWRPYYECSGPMKPAEPLGCPWFHLELDSHCNLRCALCYAGNAAGYVHPHGRMSLDFVEKCYDKIQTESSHASIRCYGNSEPFLYPWLPEVIAGAKRHGFGFELATNLNYVQRLEETMAAGPTYMLIGFSGWDQKTYSKTHVGGDIEKVKANMIKVADLRSKYPIPVYANYHCYLDNQGEEMSQARIFAKNCDFIWLPSPARAISIENTIAYLRHMEKGETGSVPPMGKDSKGYDWDAILPPVTKNYLEHLQRLAFSPERSRAFYEKWPVAEDCPLQNIGCYIRWDGKVTLCATMSDRRLDIGNYLDMTQAQMSEARKGHPLCNECIRYRYNLYCCLVDYDLWHWNKNP
jgi:organic radical activating enzyme